MAANEDRNTVQRHKKRLTVRFGIEELSRVAFSEDVSLTGMFIRTPNIYPPNTKIRIEFEIADSKVELVARVMWAKRVPQNLFHLVKKSGMGVRFLLFHSGESHFNNYLKNSNSC
jgi:PilZ domain